MVKKKFNVDLEEYNIFEMESTAQLLRKMEANKDVPKENKPRSRQCSKVVSPTDDRKDNNTIVVFVPMLQCLMADTYQNKVDNGPGCYKERCLL